MKRDQLKKRSGSALLVFSLLFGLGMILSTTARAQSQDDRYDRDRDNASQNRRGRDWDRYDNYGGSAELRRTALNAG